MITATSITATSTADNVIGLILAAAAVLYLLIVLIFPERF